MTIIQWATDSVKHASVTDMERYLIGKVDL
jgi:hypothetical protein